MAEENINQSIRPTSKDISPALLGVNEVMDNPSKIVSITWANFKQLKPEWLGDEDLVYELKLFVADVCESSDLADIGQVLTSLYNLLRQIPSFVDERPDLFREYLRMLTVLKGSMLSNMSDSDMAAFLKEDLLFALEVPDFELEDKLNDVFALARGFPVRIDVLRKLFFHALEENLEYLGTSGLQINNEDIERPPTIRNWILDYNQFAASLASPTVQQIKRGGVERAAYITQSENVRNLTDDERQILLRLLEIYDWLKFGFTQTTQVKSPSVRQLSPDKPTRVLVPPAPRLQIPKPPVFVETPKLPVIVAPPIITSVVKPVPDFIKPKVQGITPEELKREVMTPELPSYIPLEPKVIETIKPPVISAEVKPAPVAQQQMSRQAIPPVPRPVQPQTRTVVPPVERQVVPSPKPAQPPPAKSVAPLISSPNPAIRQPIYNPPAPKSNFSSSQTLAGLRSLEDIKYVDDLKKIQIAHLRQGSLPPQVAKIKSKISYLAAVNHLFPQEVVSIFELSPLFRLYLTVGNAMISNTSADRRTAFEEAISKIKASGNEDMTLSEFETVADLKKDIERM